MPRTHHARRAQRRSNAGFTLIEMIAVIALIAAVAALVGGKIISNQKRAQWRLAETQLKNLANEVDQYNSDVGRFPETLQQLLAAPGDADGWLGPYAKVADLKDPWHKDIAYTAANGDNAFELRSLGADGKPGGDGADKDIVAP